MFFIGLELKLFLNLKNILLSSQPFPTFSTLYKKQEQEQVQKSKTRTSSKVKNIQFVKSSEVEIRR